MPYGYCLSKEGNLIPNPDEIKTMLLAKEKRAAGMTLRAIADELTKAGLKARTGNPFLAQQIRNMVKKM